MKKISLLLSLALMVFATTFVACEDDPLNINDIQNNGDENDNYQMYSFNETLNYNSTKASTGSAFWSMFRRFWIHWKRSGI